MPGYIVERQLRYRLEAESKESALALSYLVDPEDSIETVWSEGGEQQ